MLIVLPVNLVVDEKSERRMAVDHRGRERQEVLGVHERGLAGIADSADETTQCALVPVTCRELRRKKMAECGHSDPAAAHWLGRADVNGTGAVARPGAFDR